MPQKFKSKEFPVERLREFYNYDYETGYLLSRDSRWPGRVIKGSLSSDKSKWAVKLRREDGSTLSTNYGRCAFAWHYGRWPDGEIDHIDREPRNNRIENLREADKALQNQNKPSYNYGTYWNKQFNKWQAQIQINIGKSKNLGRFETQKEAQETYMRACDEIGREYLPATLVDDKYVPTERLYREEIYIPLDSF